MGSDRSEEEEAHAHDDSASISGNSHNDRSCSGSDTYSGGISLSNSQFSGTNRSGTDEEEFDNYVAGRGGKEALSTAKMFVLVFLCTLAGVTSWLWWKFATENQRTTYHDEFNQFAAKIVQAFYERADYRAIAAASLATSLSATQTGISSTQWPFVSFSNFERRIAASRRMAQATAVWFAPLVASGQRASWEDYAARNQYYLENNYTDPLDHKYTTSDGAISPYRQANWAVEDGMYRFQDGQATSQEADTTSLYYAPIWQSAPSPVTSPFAYGIAMFQQTSDYIRQQALQSLEKARTTVFSASRVQGSSDSLLQGYDDGPHVCLYAPILQDVLSSNTMVGSLTMDISWHSFWDGAVDGIKGPLTVLLESTCDDDNNPASYYTFEVGQGIESSIFLGQGVKPYENNQLDLTFASTYEEFAGLLDLNTVDVGGDSACLYRIRLYPTQAFEDALLTDRPMLSALGFAAIYLLTAVVFICYDRIIQNRQKRVLLSAKRSTAIIKSLFPAGFRDQLLEDEKNKKKFESMLPKNYSPMETSKMRLEKYLAPLTARNVGGAGGSRRRSDNRNVASGIVGSEPIAEFYPATSVMFADLSGFTAWSSTREPAQVFMLLETLYGAMDKTARRLGVFKVETVGDCYVAATGIPDPRVDHAVLMAKFANTCLVQIKDLTGTLESQLGPGTGDLAFRIGIHSGPVTAGVLRGEKSRFQLFGDTMNIASRIESSGKAGCIHVSKETADLLVTSGKEEWLDSKQEAMTVKGKSVTYWLKTNFRKSGHSSLKPKRLNETTEGPSPRENSPEDTIGNTLGLSALSGISKRRKSMAAWGNDMVTQNKCDRLVDYNAEVMISLLKKIIARRSVAQGDLKEAEQSTRGTIALDEVKEVITMPEYNAEAAVRMASDYTIEIAENVRTEMRAFVRRLSSMYQDNPFHNFEHASHVALSANKLLKRIVMPEGVDYKRSGKEKVIEKMLGVAQDLHEHTLGISSDPTAQFAVVFAALVHDVDHPGVPNGILAKEQPTMAEKYRHKSIAEQRSIDVAWDILMEDSFVNLRRCMFPNSYELRHFRQLVVNTVLATDIFDKELGQLRKARWQKCFHPEQLAFNEEDKRDALNRKATIVIEYIIQASDVAHTMQHWHVYQKWNERLFREMYAAYKEGRSDKDPSEGWYKGELWFFDNYVIPLANKLHECGVFGVSSAEYLQYATENRDEWERKGHEVCKTMVTNFEESLRESQSPGGSDSNDVCEEQQSSL